MDLTQIVGRKRLTEQDAVRVLIILYELGRPTELPDAHRVLETQVYLQKLDYLLRSPADLAYVLLDQYSTRDDLVAFTAEIRETVRRLVLDREPKLRTMSMQKFRFGPWERLDDVEAYLSCRDLIRVSAKIGQGAGRLYVLTTTGAQVVRDLYEAWPELGYYRHMCSLIGRFLGHLQGTALKDYLYSVLQRIDETALGQPIPSHADLVPFKYRQVFGESL